MKRRPILAAIALLVFLFGSRTAFPQILAGPVRGKVTNNGDPLANAKVVLVNAVGWA